MEWTDFVQQVLLIFITASVPIITASIVNILKRNGALAVLQEKEAIVQKGVEFVEQVYTDLEGEEKYNKALEWISTQLSAKGIKFTVDELKGLIEATVYQFNKTWNELIIEE